MKKLLISLFMLTALVACQANNEPTAQPEKKQEQKVEEKKSNLASISIKTDEKEIETTVAAGDTILSSTKKEFDVEEEKGFITSIDGVKNNDENKQYWMLYVNGKMAQEGANAIKIHKGDKVEWKFEKYKG